MQDLVPLLGPRTRLVAVSLVSFYNGFMIPVSELIPVVTEKIERAPIAGRDPGTGPHPAESERS